MLTLALQRTSRADTARAKARRQRSYPVYSRSCTAGNYGSVILTFPTLTTSLHEAETDSLSLPLRNIYDEASTITSALLPRTFRQVAIRAHSCEATAN